MPKYKIGARSFTRKGKMSFQDLILFMMNMVNKTLQREINDYIKNIKREKINYQKSSMSTCVKCHWLAFLKQE